jgi:serine/threonine-protein kinase RIO1
LGYNQYLDVQNKRKDSTLKDIEIELKKIELEEKREERDAERIHRENDVDTATLHFFQYIQSRTEITYFRIDGKQIKPIQGPQP